MNVNSNIHLFGKAVFVGTLTLDHTLLIDIIKCIYGILTQKLAAILLEIIMLTLTQKENVNSSIHLFGKVVFEGTLTLDHTLSIDIISNAYKEFLQKTFSNILGNHHPQISTEGECQQ